MGALVGLFVVLVWTAVPVFLGFLFWRRRRRQRRQRRRELDREWRRQQRWPEQRETAGVVAPRRAPPARPLDVEVEPTVKSGRRCPFCHSDVEHLAGVACATCLARHHEACWDDHGACSACGATERFASVERTRPRERA